MPILRRKPRPRHQFRTAPARVEKWEDGTAAQLRRLLREFRTRIEDAALADPQTGDPSRASYWRELIS